MGISKMDSSAVYTLFEELKQKIDELGKRATPINQINSTSDPEELISLIEDLQIRINQQQFTPEHIKALQTNMAQYFAYSLGKVNDSLRKVITELKTEITSIDEKNSPIKSPQNTVIRKENVFIVDFRNSKAAITIITLALLFLFSLSGNIWQFSRNIQFKDNDLKYHYIKSTNGISSDNLHQLESIFTINRDDKKVKVIRLNVQKYEQKLKEITLKFEHTQSKDEQNKNKKLQNVK